MRCHRLGRRLLIPALLLAGAPGCATVPASAPVSVQVTDAESKQPIPGAVVRFAAPVARSAGDRENPSATTGGDGVARLAAARGAGDGVMVQVSANDYSYEQTYLPLTSASGAGRAAVTVELYASPRPVVELVLPDGYHGSFQVEVHVRDGAPCEPGQRVFRCEVPLSGDARLDAPSLFRHFPAPEFRARYASGTALEERPGEGIGLWWLRSEGGREYFLVGTRGEYAELSRSEQKENTGKGSRPSGGGKGAGRGRHGRGGGGPAAPAPGAPAADPSAPDPLSAPPS